MKKRMPRISGLIPAGVTAFATMVLSAPLSTAAPELSDKDITRAVEAELLLDEAVASHLIDVNTEAGIVTLSGTVDNILARDRAETVATTIKGVRSVVNNIDVNPVPRADAEIREDVEATLLEDPAADSYEIDVTVEDGKVTLSGNVESWTEKRLAGEVAKGVRGVRELTNNITYEIQPDRPDFEIQAEIERRLQRSAWVDAGLIDVEVVNGNVTLSGTVGSAIEKRNARYTAWVAGVENVDVGELKTEWWARDETRRDKKYAAKSDQELEQAVEDALLYDPRVALYHIQVSANAGVVSLSGIVDNLKAKRAAERDAMNTLGVWRVENFIKVRPEELIADEKLRRNVQEALARDPYLERWEIDVGAYNGQVYLSGTVDNAFERNHAKDVVSRLKGVVTVKNNLEVRPSLTGKSDRQIKEDIESQLFWSWFVDSDAVNVSVQDGVATLTGQVDTWYERSAAEENAYEGGARNVINELAVDYGPGYYSRYPYAPYYDDYTHEYNPYYGLGYRSRHRDSYRGPYGSGYPYRYD